MFGLQLASFCTAFTGAGGAGCSNAVLGRSVPEGIYEVTKVRSSPNILASSAHDTKLANLASAVRGSVFLLAAAPTAARGQCADMWSGAAQGQPGGAERHYQRPPTALIADACTTASHQASKTLTCRCGKPFRTGLCLPARRKLMLQCEADAANARGAGRKFTKALHSSPQNHVRAKPT